MILWVSPTQSIRYRTSKITYEHTTWDLWWFTDLHSILSSSLKLQTFRGLPSELWTDDSPYNRSYEIAHATICVGGTFTFCSKLEAEDNFCEKVQTSNWAGVVTAISYRIKCFIRYVKTLHRWLLDQWFQLIRLVDFHTESWYYRNRKNSSVYFDTSDKTKQIDNVLRWCLDTCWEIKQHHDYYYCYYYAN